MVFVLLWAEVRWRLHQKWMQMTSHSGSCFVLLLNTRGEFWQDQFLGRIFSSWQNIVFSSKTISAVESIWSVVTHCCRPCSKSVHVALLPPSGLNQCSMWRELLKQNEMINYKQWVKLFWYAHLFFFPHPTIVAALLKNGIDWKWHQARRAFLAGIQAAQMIDFIIYSAFLCHFILTYLFILLLTCWGFCSHTCFVGFFVL